MIRRLGVICALAALGVVLAAPSASAHALLGASEPARDAEVSESPTHVVLAFSEEPELSLSSVEVFDLDGRPVHAGETEVDPTDELILRRAVESLDDGVYSVSWRVLSRVDGHVTAGTFVFGVRVDPTTVDLSGLDLIDEEPRPSVLEVTGRWALLIGLGLLIGVAWIAAATGLSGVGRLPWLGLGLATIGLVLLAEAQRRAAGTDMGTLLGTSIGRALVLRAVGIAVAALGLAVAARVRGAVRTWTYVVVGVAAAGAAFAHAAAGHAATGAGLWVKVIRHWVHVVAVGVWLGGLAGLLVGIRGTADEIKARAVRRFSTVAGVTLVVVAVTGIFRAIDELPTVADLWGSPYGIVVIIKVVLFAVLVGLGAVNRYRSVPRSSETLSPLRRVSRIELSVALATMLAAAVLAGFTPPRPVSAIERVASSPVVVTGQDLGGSVAVELTVTPGTPGPNEFIARITDARTGEAVAADRARLLFRYLEEPSGESQVELTRGDDGLYRASAADVALPGRWSLTILLQTATDSVEIPMRMATKCRAEALPIEGGPTLYDVVVGDGTAQGYTDPGETGFNEIHITFFDADGSETEIPTEPEMFATPEEGERTPLVVRRFSQGHFVGDAQLDPGLWRFDVTAVGPGGQTVRLCFNDVVRS